MPAIPGLTLPPAMMLDQRILTPCIGVCSTAIGDSVCRGCKRFHHEVIDWNAYGEAEKRCVDQRLEQLLTRVVQGKLRIVDAGRLQAQIRLQQIRTLPYRGLHCALFELLRAGAGQIHEPAAFGFAVEPAWQHLDMVALRELIDREFFILSELYYERHCRAGSRVEQP